MTKLTTGAYYLKRGDVSDYEDGRMTHRLQVARGILNNLGHTPEVHHCDLCKEGAAGGGCWDACKTVWVPEVSNEVFNAAFTLADAKVTMDAEKNWRSIAA